MDTQHSEPLTKPSQIQELSRVLSGHSTIAFDTEFIRETTFFPCLELIQVATDSQSWLVDVQAFRRSQNLSGLAPLLEIFQSDKILKIVHAAQADEECLYTEFKTLASPIMDTAIAGSLCGYGEGVGLGNLLKSVLDIRIKKGMARTHWGTRPLSKQLLEYAHADVLHLVSLGKKLIEELKSLDRFGWALELSAQYADPTMYDVPPEEIAQRLSQSGKIDHKSYPVLLELVRWRERRVRELNIPRRWLADDSVLMDLAHVRPTDVGHLSSFRGLNKGEIKNRSEEILSAIRRGIENVQAEMPERIRFASASAREGHVIDLFKCYLSYLADEYRISSKQLLTSHQILPIIRSQPQSVEQLISKGLLSHGAAKLVGEEIVQFLRGKRSISVDKDDIAIEHRE